MTVRVSMIGGPFLHPNVLLLVAFINLKVLESCSNNVTLVPIFTQPSIPNLNGLNLSIDHVFHVCLLSNKLLK